VKSANKPFNDFNYQVIASKTMIQSGFQAIVLNSLAHYIQALAAFSSKWRGRCS
jgi:hypothetical protein